MFFCLAAKFWGKSVRVAWIQWLEFCIKALFGRLVSKSVSFLQYKGKPSKDNLAGIILKCCHQSSPLLWKSASENNLLDFFHQETHRCGRTCKGFVGCEGEMIPVSHLGMSMFFPDMQSSVGSSSIQVSSWLPNSQRAMFLTPWIICAEVSSSSPHSVSGPDQDVAISYMERFCHREVCSTCQILSLSLAKSWVETRRREKKHEKSALVVEKAGRVSTLIRYF